MKNQCALEASFNKANFFLHWANLASPYPNNAKCHARMRQVSILQSLVWLDQVSQLRTLYSNPQSLDSPISQTFFRSLYNVSYQLELHWRFSPSTRTLKAVVELMDSVAAHWRLFSQWDLKLLDLTMVIQINPTHILDIMRWLRSI